MSDIYECPACHTGRLHVLGQTFTTVSQEDDDAELPTTDDFVESSCDNEDCLYTLAQNPGDGRLRNADLMRDMQQVRDQPELEEQWRAQVEAILDAAWKKQA